YVETFAQWCTKAVCLLLDDKTKSTTYIKLFESLNDGQSPEYKHFEEIKIKGYCDEYDKMELLNLKETRDKSKIIKEVFLIKNGNKDFNTVYKDKYAEHKKAVEAEIKRLPKEKVK